MTESRKRIDIARGSVSEVWRRVQVDDGNMYASDDFGFDDLTADELVDCFDLREPIRTLDRKKVENIGDVIGEGEFGVVVKSGACAIKFTHHNIRRQRGIDWSIDNVFDSSRIAQGLHHGLGRIGTKSASAPRHYAAWQPSFKDKRFDARCQIQVMDYFDAQPKNVTQEDSKSVEK